MIKRSCVQVPAGVVGEFSSPGSTFYIDSYFSKCSTAVAVKDPGHFVKGAGGRLLLNTQCMHHMYTAFNKVTLSTGAWLHGVHRTCAQVAAVSHGTSHVTTKQSCNHIKKCAV